MGRTLQKFLLAVLLLALIAIVGLPYLSQWAVRSLATGEFRRAESVWRTKYVAPFRARLELRAFDALEAKAAELRSSRECFPSGVAKLGAFYEETFGRLPQERMRDPDAWLLHLERLREWVDTRPGSITARVALAHALIGRAWAARGGGWASSVSEARAQSFEHDLDEARQLLLSCAPAARDEAEWYRALMKTQHGLGDDPAYRETYRIAFDRFPEDERFHIGMAGHLMPRWFGQPGEWERFAESCASQLPDSIGDEMYVRMLVDQDRFALNLFREHPQLSWERTRRGADAWHRRCPGSTQPMSALALFAWQTGHREDARRAFEAIGDTLELDVWHFDFRFGDARKWAQAGVPALANRD
ncbi:MAG: DUF4034 domain-containing protein [Candidatus Eisenbacteria bacterium]|uniref:DUF4034 domain-containing protein n=1 Tax=Eiseniibacteriota bacterium TaxID=2212470 RepID=A0A849SEP2_UNCEI|nr:DUF4034 domain-containing protein [Candidatus Eisenbacteria bacterium]